MAVVVQCYHCNAVLELDEGFRGGVCRCSGCGSLLQVPRGEQDKRAPRPARPAAPPSPSANASPPPPASGDSRSPRPSPSIDAHTLSSGLNQVHKTRPINKTSKKTLKKPGESGASSAGVVSHSAGRSAATEPPPSSTPLPRFPPLPRRRNNRLLWAAIGAIILIGLAVVGLLGVYMLRHDAEPPAEAAAPPAALSKENSFANIPLTGRRVILSFDGAASMADAFDFLRRGTLRAANRINPDQQMLVTLWTDDGLKQLPSSGFGKGEGWAREIEPHLQAFAPGGVSDAEKCMTAALHLAEPGDQVIFVTAKPDLPAALAIGVLPARKENVRIDGVKLNTQDTPSPLETLAKVSGGLYLYMSVSELDQVTR
jgi:hypothetical protein